MYVIVYDNGAGDLYSEEFNNRGEVDKWLEENDYKAIVVSGDALQTEDRT